MLRQSRSEKFAQIEVLGRFTLPRRQVGDEPPIAGMGRKVRLTYRGEAAHAPFLSRIAKETGVDFSLHSGRVAQIKGEPYGQLTLSLDGAQIDDALARFTAAGVRVTELTA